MASILLRWGGIVLATCHAVLVNAATEVETVQVIGKQNASVFIESKLEVEQKLKQVAGGTNLVDMEQNTKLSTLSDALNFQPGIIVQEFFGGLDQPRINIRGSGIQGNPVSRGVLLRQDYLPLNEADGSFIIGLVNLRNSAMVAVHRGANSRAPGSFTLGGDMNFITKNQSNKMHFETGSFGQQAIQASYGFEDDSSLWHGDYVSEKAEGYRHHSASQRTQASLKFSTKFGNSVSNHTYVNHTDMGFEMPFVLPKDQAEENPTTVLGDGVPINFSIPNLEFIDVSLVANELLNLYKRDPHRTTEQYRIANRTVILLDESEHQIGWYWQSTDDAFVDPFTHIETQTKTVGLQWLYDRFANDYFHYQIGTDLNQSDMPRSYTGNHPLQGSKVGNAYADFDLSAKNQAVSMLFDVLITPEFTFTGQWQQGSANRKGVDVAAKADRAEIDLNWNYHLAKLGIIYQPSFSNSRLFFNVSESIELPTFWELVAVELNPMLTWMSQATLREIEPQTALSIELGGEHFIGRDWSWQATAYRSHIEKELISTASQLGVLAETHNYDSETVHQGIEFGFNGKSQLQNSSMLYRSSWTYSDFYFEDGQYAGNQIAGVPKNVIMLEGRWQYSGLQLGPNLRWVPDDNPVDHENSLGQGDYILLGFALDYFYQDFLRCFLVLDNLTDETYNSSYVVRAKSTEALPTFLPGNGRSLSAGISFEF